MHPYLSAALGGILIGLASWLLLAGLGRIAGISGITCSALRESGGPAYWRWAFLLGLILGGALFAQWLPAPELPARAPLLIVAAGLLVGFGSVRGSGCTSGHGVCGLGRRSLRSLVAVLTFMASAFVTVFLTGGLQ
ncbi:YeeE/YedE family protein [Malikia spinosa]|uniref:YeeE/YedE family protein n=1 Tax=Malikia spinosa TaxID=86180 RepID=A0A7C9MWX5_9BURK|nr:YeeE/YedE thiosulfate transporter family protein [Malikia spinosa]MYZ51821.1 YeeE/YedE family protein [Malikia spinosa]OGB69521.1 MAG: YeeE/YedE family protein [Burkholderiales bacterium RIFOXYC12_FULL_65_23]